MNNDVFVVTPAKAVLLGIAMVVALFAWEGHLGFSLWDEGYLWYGVQRVMSGEVPIRDFQAYDPGRYYWSAALMRLSGTHGLMALRETVVIIQALALAAALGCLAAVGRKRGDFLFILLCALTLLVWMVPRHKLFDISLSITLVCVLALLIQRPSGSRYFGAGLMVGAAACFGRNHGVYGLAASIGTLFYLSLRCKDWSAWRLGAASFFAGIFIGYLPIILMLFLVRGFAPAFIESVKFLFEIKATNLPLPIPWPWKVRFSDGPFSDSARQLLIGVFFVATLLFGCLAPLYVVVGKIRKKPLEPLFVACAFSALPYAHYAFSRADPGHLAQGIFPLLIGTLAIASQYSERRRWSAAGVLCAASVFAMIALHPAWQCRDSGACEQTLIGDDRLLIDRGTARDVSLLRSLKEKLFLCCAILAGGVRAV
jgi:hypothetical protein